MDPAIARAPAVLIVDDEPLIRWAPGTAFEDRGYVVIEANSAATAAAALGARPQGFDAAALDLRLPDSTDLSLLNHVKRAFPLSPVLIMTAFVTSETTADAIARGAVAVISKPFGVRDVVSLFDRPGNATCL